MASVRGGVQWVAVGAVLLVVFRHTGLSGAFGWVALMVVIAGQVAGRRGAGVPRARRAATIGVATGTVVTLGALVVLGVIATESRVLVPVGGMIVSSAMLAAGVALRRLGEEARAARPAIEARACPSACRPVRRSLPPTVRVAHRAACHRCPRWPSGCCRG